MSTEESKHLIENLKRAYKAAIVDPLVQKLAAATRKRFRAQARAVGRAIRGKLSESDATKGRAAATAALGAFSYPAWLKAHQKATSAAYGGGSGVAAGQLAAEIPDDLVGFSGSAEEAAAAIDETTVSRLLDAITDDLTGSAVEKAAAGVFRSAVEDRVDTIALHEVSGSFHEGMTDSAAAISLDTGDDVEKHWEAEDDACEECIACDDEGWVDLDFTYPAFGVDEPDGHPNCRCSLEVRRAES